MPALPAPLPIVFSLDEKKGRREGERGGGREGERERERERERETVPVSLPYPQYLTEPRLAFVLLCTK